MAKNETNSYEAGGMAFVGCIVLGLGLGFIFDNIPAGVITGTGVGFIVMSVMRYQDSK